MPSAPRALDRAKAFCAEFGMQVPVLLAPMAGAGTPDLSAAVANAGGLGGCGAFLMEPAAIKAWVSAFRSKSSGGYQVNLWIPDPKPSRDDVLEDAVRAFLREWGPEVPREAGNFNLPDFEAQCEAVLELGPPIASSIMGLFNSTFIERLRSKSMRWFATATTVAEAKAACEAGANVIVAQGMEAGGHRGSFDASRAETETVGLFSLLPAVVDAVRVPVVAAGGIADARSVAAALLLGASAVQIGTGFLRSPEAMLPSAWADAIGRTLPEQTMITRGFSGRAARSIVTSYARAASAPGAPFSAPYPVQWGLTQAMRDRARRTNDVECMQAWCGQSGTSARALPAGDIVRELWGGAQRLLG